MKAWTEMTPEEQRGAARKGDAVLLMPVLQTYRDVAHALTRAVVDCPLSYHDGRPMGDRATDRDTIPWLQRLARISEAVEAIDAREAVEADRLRRDIGDLRLALRDAPTGGASGDAPPWIIRLHRAACEVAGIGVRESEAKFAAGIVLHDDEVRVVDAASVSVPIHHAARPRWATSAEHAEASRAASGRCLTAECPGMLGPDCEGHHRCTECGFMWSVELVAALTAAAVRESPAAASGYAACSTCSAELLFSARARGDGLCGPCHRKATGTQVLADRCREAGLEPSLVLEILASPEARQAISEWSRDVDGLELIRRYANAIRDILGSTPDPRIGKLCRPGEWNGGVARVVGVESNGRYLLVREENWSAACEDARVRASDVEWIGELPVPSPGSVDIALAAYLASPEGRAAIAECVRRPPVRMPDGTWREPTPGSEAKPGDVVRCSATGRGGKVYRLDGENLWLYAEGGGYETMRAADVEVVVPAECAPAIRQPLAKPRPGPFDASPHRRRPPAP